MNVADPLTFFLLALLAGIVLAAIYFAVRETIADAILLAEKKRKAQEQEERKNRR